MNKYVNYGILSAIIAVLLVFAYKYVSRPVIVNEIIQETDLDTVYIQSPPKIITKVIVQDTFLIDTIYATDTVIVIDTYRDTFIYRVVDVRPTLQPIINTTEYRFNEGMLKESYSRLRVYGGVLIDSRGWGYTSPTIYFNTDRINFGFSKTINNNEFKITAAIRLGKD